MMRTATYGPIIPRAPRRRYRAFSMLEVLAALVIFSVLATTVFRLNHQVEKRFYRPVDTFPALRHQVHRAVRGWPQTDEDLRVTVSDRAGVPHCRAEKQGHVLWYIPPPTDPSAR